MKILTLVNGKWGRMVGLGKSGEVLVDEGQDKMGQWSFLQVSVKKGLVLLSFGKLSPPSLAAEQRRRRQEFAV